MIPRYKYVSSCSEDAVILSLGTRFPQTAAQTRRCALVHIDLSVKAVKIASFAGEQVASIGNCELKVGCCTSTRQSHSVCAACCEEHIQLHSLWPTTESGYPQFLEWAPTTSRFVISEWLRHSSQDPEIISWGHRYLTSSHPVLDKYLEKVSELWTRFDASLLE
jgi:hypothetical protein